MLPRWWLWAGCFRFLFPPSLKVESRINSGVPFPSGQLTLLPARRSAASTTFMILTAPLVLDGGQTLEYVTLILTANLHGG